MTACNLAVSRSDKFIRNPTSHSFTDVSDNKLLLRFIYNVKHSLHKNNIFSKAVVSSTHLKCCYFSISSHSFHSFSATQKQLNVQRLPTAQNEFLRSQSISEIWADASTCPYYLNAHIFRVLLMCFVLPIRAPCLMSREAYCSLPPPSDPLKYLC
jgi:hypothetical protein